MKHAHQDSAGKSGLELAEEAAHLLRAAPMATLAAYYVGEVPFVLGLLYFWTDMSQNPFAGSHLAEAALGMALLFLWMKCWQSIFAGGLRAQLAAEPPPRWTARRCLRIFLSQAGLQPLALFLMPLAACFVLPWPWVSAFFQNVTVLSDGDSAGASKLARRAWKHSLVWPMQNVVLVLVVQIGFALFVLLNWIMVGLLLPHLLKTLLGVDSVFTRSRFLLNPTFLLAMAGLAWLCVDPILKSAFVLRCFYADSRHSGEDLKAALKRFAPAAQMLAAALLLLIVISATRLNAAPSHPGAAPSASPPKSASRVSPQDLDETIGQTLQERRYTWRLPREETANPEANQNVVSRFFDNVLNMIRRGLRAVARWIERWIRKLLGDRGPGPSGSGTGWMTSLELLLYGLLAAVIIALVLLLFRVWRQRRDDASPVQAEPIQSLPDLRDENISADQLPEDGWTRLARELLARGELRLALRAFYLASLAHLAGRNLIRIARFKSNRDYERELGRRSHVVPQLLEVFGENIFLFERIWYGAHEVNNDIVNRFVANVDKMKGAA